MSNKNDLIERVKLMTSMRDGDLFAKTCVEARAEISRLLESNQYKLSANLSKHLADGFGVFFERDKEFVEKTIQHFPVNDYCTVMQLGKSEDIDKYILSEKIDIANIDIKDKSLIRELVSGLTKSHNMHWLGIVIQHISSEATGKYKGSKALASDVWSIVFNQILDNNTKDHPLTDAIDEAMSKFATYNHFSSHDAKILPRVARMGLNKTLISILKYNLVKYYRPAEFKVRENKLVYQALPKKPTPEEAAWIIDRIEYVEFRGMVFSDPDFDFSKMVKSLKKTKGGRSHRLHEHSILNLKDVLTPEFLNTKIRQQRATTLLDAALELDTVKNTESKFYLLNKLIGKGVSRHIKLIATSTKIKTLEEDMGI
ncbi:hypothetical protein [Pseudomonas putida]|uniref:Uncharacterized protein n=1 Tax=Pseudomonas putida TaxID=303 RepID=A0A8I1ECI9_PSEPU|nr:hypothetical protein [Pseudomonas putida]MBI6882784.1 hypothetical protein [Pseudomonas putida]